MARVRNISADELPPDLAAIHREFAASYGPFANQVAVFAHVPAALRHLMPMLMELRAAADPAQALSRDRHRRRLQPQRLPLLRGAPQALPGGDRPVLRRHRPDHGLAGPPGAGCDRQAGGGIRHRRLGTSNRIPEALFRRLRADFTEAQIVELTLRITLCGFFNRFNDAMGIEEEPEVQAAAE